MNEAGIKKVALYARVSTKDKDQTPENQFRRLREYCTMKNWDYTEYNDFASGSKSDRPGLKLLLEDYQEYDGVLVLRIDRFGRSLQHLILNLEFLQKKGKFFEAIDQGIRISEKRDPTNNFLFSILGAAAEYERELISERVRDGIYRAKGKDPQKKVNGRKSLQERFGDRFPKIYELRDQGKTIREISQLVGITRSSVQKILSEKSPPENSCTPYINPPSSKKNIRKELFSGQNEKVKQ